MSTGDLDVRCLPYMPLQIEQLRKSKAWLRCRRRPELGFYLMNLWMRAWHEVPAGSIEDDDDVLADAAMCSPEKWGEFRPLLLEGWEVRDGRVYHRTVTELATEAFGKLRKNQKRTEAAREAAQKAADKKRAPIVTESVTETVTASVTEVVTGPEGKGREENKDSSSSPPDGATKIDVPLQSKKSLQDEFDKTFWPAYPRKVDKKDALKAFMKARSVAPLVTIMAGLRVYVLEVQGKEAQFVRHAARWLNAESWTNGPAAPGEAPAPVDDHGWGRRLRYARSEHKWSTSRWGPAPGKPDCSVPSHLLQPGDGLNWIEWENAA